MKTYDAPLHATLAYARAYEALRVTHYPDLPTFPGLRLIRSRKTYGRAALGRDIAGRREVRGFHLSVHFTRHLAEPAFRAHVAHEVAHAVAWLRHGDHGHGDAWKREALRLGIEPTRCSHHTTSTGERIMPARPEPRFTLTCGGCSTVVARYHKSTATAVKEPWRFRCARCGTSGSQFIVADRA